MGQGKLKRLGLIGGISPESTAVYYRALNAAARAALGPRHSLEHVVFSLDYGVVIALYDRQDWPAFRAEMIKAGRALQAAGAEAIVICSNTSQLAAEAVGEATGLPVIHLLDALAAAMDALKVRRPLLMGTPVVMAGPFYRPDLASRYGGEVIVPTPEDQATIARVIFDELVFGDVRAASRAAYLEIVERGRAAGADGVILGCTELCLILDQSHTDLPVFDTTALHAAAAARFALEGA